MGQVFRRQIWSGLLLNGLTCYNVTELQMQLLKKVEFDCGMTTSRGTLGAQAHFIFLPHHPQIASSLGPPKLGYPTVCIPACGKEGREEVQGQLEITKSHLSHFCSHPMGSNLANPPSWSHQAENG